MEGRTFRLARFYIGCGAICDHIEMVSYQRLDLIRIHRKALGTIPFDYLREIARCPCRQNTNVHLRFLCISACPPLSTGRGSSWHSDVANLELFYFVAKFFALFIQKIYSKKYVSRQCQNYYKAKNCRFISPAPPQHKSAISKGAFATLWLHVCNVAHNTY